MQRALPLQEGRLTRRIHPLRLGRVGVPQGGDVAPVAVVPRGSTGHDRRVEARVKRAILPSPPAGMRSAGTARPVGSWPIGHTAHLTLLVFLLQPFIFVVLFVDEVQADEAATSFSLRTALAHLTRLVRGGSTQGASRTWSLTLALKGMIMMQAWYCTRMKAWCSLAESYERRERLQERRARHRTATQQMEALALSALSLPLLWLFALAILVLTGAPVQSHVVGTLTLAAYLALLGLWPLTHVLGTPPSAFWLRVLSAPSTIVQRELLVLLPCAGAWLGAWFGAATQALDWGRAWQAWPLPSVYGAAIGVVLGHAVAFIAPPLVRMVRGGRSST